MGTYFLKYFCGACHTGTEEMVIPARMLTSWDLGLYPVSRPASRFIREIATEPVFDISVLHPELYHQVASLARARVLREKLKHLKGFVLTCRDRAALLQELGTR